MSAKFSITRKEERPAVRALPPLQAADTQPTDHGFSFSGSCHLAAPVGFSETTEVVVSTAKVLSAPPLQEMPLKVTYPCIPALPYSAGVSTRLTDKEGYDFCPGEALLVNMETGETEVTTMRPVIMGRPERSEKKVRLGWSSLRKLHGGSCSGGSSLLSSTCRAWSGTAALSSIPDSC